MFGWSAKLKGFGPVVNSSGFFKMSSPLLVHPEIQTFYKYFCQFQKLYISISLLSLRRRNKQRNLIQFAQKLVVMKVST